MVNASKPPDRNGPPWSVTLVITRKFSWSTSAGSATGAPTPPHHQWHAHSGSTTCTPDFEEPVKCTHMINA